MTRTPIINTTITMQRQPDESDPDEEIVFVPLAVELDVRVADVVEAFGSANGLDETGVVEPLLFNIACNLAALLPP